MSIDRAEGAGNARPRPWTVRRERCSAEAIIEQLQQVPVERDDDTWQTLTTPGPAHVGTAVQTYGAQDVGLDAADVVRFADYGLRVVEDRASATGQPARWSSTRPHACIAA